MINVIKNILAILFLLNISNIITQEVKDLAKAVRLSLKIKEDEQKKEKESLRPQITIFQVVSQSGADCGFHAVQIGKIIYEWLTGKISQDTCLANLKSKNVNIFPLKLWRDQIENRYQCKTNLSDQELTYLAGIALSPASKYPNFTVIPNLYEFKIDDSVIGAVKKLRNINNSVHIFFIGNMQHIEDKGKLTGTSGHWIAVVVQNKNYQIKYYTGDSLGGLKEYNVYDIILPLQDLIEFQNFDLLKNMPQIDTLLDSVIILVGKKKLNNALKNINNIINIVTQNNLKKNDVFKAKYLPKIKALLEKIAGLDKSRDLKFSTRAIDLISKIQ